MEDNDIVELFLARNEDAISRTAEKYGSRIRQIAYGVIGNHESAEECENDTYQKAWESIPPNEPREHLFSYLGRIVRNIALNRLKAEESKKRNAIRCELEGDISEQKNIACGNSRFDLFGIENDFEAGILAESKRYYILRDYEEAELYRKPDSKYVASVGHFYGDPEDAYIDPEGKFCITIGCGIIKYNLCEPFEGYMYDRDTSQWIETGRKGDIVWCDHIDKVTEH